ncbi:helix-turn-helix domain-containing protein [Ideonella sp.]|uniref:AraC family transcriptional regulator n=1 Tax=Ideonella sp. TaxID=1929293 RepID=UPI002B4A583D|nr:helix-turn-helix domain-containing protein [Ideonella sp.]HJV67831.1 helix-turn-helix domain-containing protein [Ideonella sp.]
MDASLTASLDLLLRGALVALLLALAVALVRGRPWATAARAGASLALGLALATLGNAPALAPAWPLAARSAAAGLASGNAVLFGVFSQALFDDAARWRAWHGLAWAAVAGLSATACAGAWAGGPAGATIAEALRWVPVACVAWAIGAALAHWRDDLVERRRRLRAFVVVAGSAYTLGMLWLRWHSPQGRLSAVQASLDTMLLLAITATLAAGLLRLRASELFAPLVVARPPLAIGPVGPDDVERADRADSGDRADAPDAADQATAAALQRLMADERPHRDEGLTLAALAGRLGVPEYRLRRVINRHLGHRNFSAFVNGHRLAEAKAALADPARRGLPVLTIALEAGFQSIGPFNRAFKADTGLTPTEFRQRALAEA